MDLRRSIPALAALAAAAFTLAPRDARAQAPASPGAAPTAAAPAPPVAPSELTPGDSPTGPRGGSSPGIPDARPSPGMADARPAPSTPDPDAERRAADLERARTAWPEEKPAPGVRAVGLDAVDDPFKGKSDFGFGYHGYFRAPLRIGWASRGGSAPSAPGAPNEGSNFRSPWLIDDDYFRSGFQYTHIQESDFAELYLMAGNQSITGTVALMASLFSDSARPFIDKQTGVSQAWVTMRWNPEILGGHLHLRLKGGSFWDRYGWLPKYDTYIFGRTHQMGEQLRATYERGDFRVTLTHGFGARLEAIDANQGFTMLQQVHVGAAYKERVEVGLYYLDSWSRDKRQLKEITDADMDVTGADARVNGGAYGRLYGAISRLHAANATFLAPAIEVMHSYGGRGITENYLGTTRSENGTGSLTNLAFQYDFSLAQLMKDFAPQWRSALHGGDVNFTFFGLYTYTRSSQELPNPQENRDRRKSFKWGTELAYWPLPWVGASMRYDRVILDTDDDAGGFRIFSPRITLRHVHALGEGQIYVQYSRYDYGARVRLRPGQIPLENMPDANVMKVQAQIAF